MDWHGDAGRIAEERAAAGDAAAPVKRPSRPKKEFGWSRARTHRIERTADGQTLLRLSDRCVLVNLLLPVCQLGRIAARGDLFEHMNDPEDVLD